MDTYKEQYIEATKKLLPHLEEIKDPDSSKKLEDFAREAIQKTIHELGIANAEPKLFEEILERVNAIHGQGQANYSNYKNILANFYRYDVDNISNENLKAIMKESRKFNVKEQFNNETFLSCLTREELDILSGTPLSLKGLQEDMETGGRKKSRKHKKRKSKKSKKSKKSRMGRFPHKKSRNKRR